MATARQAAGDALGALSGTFPAPALGLPFLGGLAYWDEFILDQGAIAGRYGDLNWIPVTIGGGAPTYAPVAPGADTEWGVLQCTTGAVANGGGLLRSALTTQFRAPQPGMTFGVKLRATALVADLHLWSGLASALNFPGGINVNSFVGVRKTAGGSVFGVVRSGTAEDTVDLGVAAELLYSTVGYDVLADGTFQFWTADASDFQVEQIKTYVGDPVVRTNVPVVGLMAVAAGFITTTGVDRTIQIDSWGLGGRLAR
jgi:hypothetical protein